MQIRTQDLPNSFSSGNKKQKAVLPETAPRASVLGEIDLSESIDQLAVSVKITKRFTRLIGMSDKRRIMAVRT